MKQKIIIKRECTTKWWSERSLPESNGDRRKRVNHWARVVYAAAAAAAEVDVGIKRSVNPGVDSLPPVRNLTFNLPDFTLSQLIQRHVICYKLFLILYISSPLHLRKKKKKEQRKLKVYFIFTLLYFPVYYKV